MENEHDGADAVDEKAHVAPPNTLAWAARACDKARELERPLWRIPPQVLNKAQVREARANLDHRAPAPRKSRHHW